MYKRMDESKKISILLLLIALIVVFIVYLSASKEKYEVGIIVNGQGLRKYPRYYESLRLPENERPPATMESKI